ncbi:MAG: hypothetical protein KDB22_15080 [Planctomycetales bacterium]|nr:hypothetical protein [Planctomycetales bacterium]
MQFSAQSYVIAIGLIGLLAFDDTNLAVGQIYRPDIVGRSTAGWVATESKTSDEPGFAADRLSATVVSPVQQAFYQSQGTLSDLPTLPSFGGSGVGSTGGGYTALPTLPDGLTGQPAQQSVAAPQYLPNNAAERSVLPQPESTLQSSVPRPPPAQGTHQDTTRSNSSQSNDPRALQSGRGVGQPTYASSPDPNTMPRSSNAARGGGLPNALSPPYAAATREDVSRATGPMTNSTQLTNVPYQRIPAQAVATGLPYVTPPPRQGNYATRAISPAHMQLAAYQRIAPVNSPVVAGTQLASNQAAAGLPQQQRLQLTSAYQCAPGPGFPSMGVPNSVAPPTLPPNLAPGLYTPNNSGYTPLFSLGQENYNVLLGRGLVGQPTVYVPGQPLRNFLRYLSP